MNSINDAPPGVGRHPGAGDADRILHAAQRTGERFDAILDLAAEGFREQPSANCVHAAGRRLCAAIASVADDVAKAKGRAA